MQLHYVNQLAALHAHEEIHAAIAAIVGVVERFDVLRGDLERAAFDAFAEARDVGKQEIEKRISREKNQREEGESTRDWRDWGCSAR